MTRTTSDVLLDLADAARTQRESLEGAESLRKAFDARGRLMDTACVARGLAPTQEQLRAFGEAAAAHYEAAAGATRSRDAWRLRRARFEEDLRLAAADPEASAAAITGALRGRFGEPAGTAPRATWSLLAAGGRRLRVSTWTESRGVVVYARREGPDVAFSGLRTEGMVACPSRALVARLLGAEVAMATLRDPSALLMRDRRWPLTWITSPAVALAAVDAMATHRPDPDAPAPEWARDPETDAF